MNIKQAGVILCLLTLNACTLHKVTNKQQICMQAQREQTLNQTSAGTHPINLSDTKTKALQETIQQNC
jgi:hypothetical protein